MFDSVLIANRGEVAVRIIRACRELGVESIAVYSTADAESLHVRLADRAVCIGPPQPRESYLSVPAIISAAEITGAQAIHPGYGFLAENAVFAEACAAHGLVFIGPRPETIDTMGNKSSARELMKKIGVPTVPGSDGPLSGPEDALALAELTGYPLVVKASAGGGGRGMRIVHRERDLADAISSAQAEAKNAFGEAEVYMEKYLEEPRHVEVQIIGDSHGNVVHLGERDCSIQRRHQKLIEESPCPAIDAKTRKKMGDAALKAAKAVDYVNAGTIEFLLDRDGSFYFIEMNTRIQVEHCVTEMVTGVDIVKEQISIAAGEPLSFAQKDVEIRGHAIEFRINAEDPEKGFIPGGGTVGFYYQSGGPGVRVDTHLYAGYKVPTNYDSLLAKLIVWGHDREEAMARGERALSEFGITGLPTTIPFHLRVLDNAFFRKGEFYTNFIARRIDSV